MATWNTENEAEIIMKRPSGGGTGGGGSGGSGGTTDYNLLYNRPKIEGVELTGDKTYEELNLGRLTNTEIETMLN